MLYATCEDACYMFTKDEWVEFAELQCSQEEADTRLLLHALHAAETASEAVVITAEDTDIMVISLAFAKRIPCKVYQKCGTKNRTRFIDIDKLADTLGEEVCKALVGLHAFTGGYQYCLTSRRFTCTLCMYPKNILHDKSHNIFKHILCIVLQLGESRTVSSDGNLFKRIERFTCQMEMWNQVHYHHVKRANYQASIWRGCLQNDPQVPSPVDAGWKLDEDGNLSITWLQSPPAPAAVLELLTCSCSRSCSLPSCTCIANGLNCTDMCKLKDCSNRKVEETEEDLVIELSSSDADDTSSDTDDE
ncbi:uncharacterized protein LOC144863800 [Branchiostoma floridae x Branchiostoma japonicum]